MGQKRIIITGCSRGIGRETVINLLRAEHQVLALSRSHASMDELKKEYDKLFSLELDITQKEELEEVVKFVERQWGTVDILIHNAGMLLNKPFGTTSLEDMLSVYQVNVFAVAELTRRMIPYLVKGSHVVAISSMGGIQGSMKFPGLAAYSSSKGALITLMELLAEEYKEAGIAFNTLALGAVQTEMLAEAFPGYMASITPANMGTYVANFALSGKELFNGKVLQVSNSTP